ncbi:MAG: quinol:cytochrome C oxidoreductase, partial [Arenibacter sp.]
MYTFSNRLKIASFILMAVGVLGIGIGFMAAPSTVEEAKAIVAGHGDGHGDAHAVAEGHGDEMGHGDAHDASHDEHLLHQLQNKPWAALYVAAFFFFM